MHVEKMISANLFRTVVLLEIAYLYFRTIMQGSGYFSDLTVIQQELARTGLRGTEITLILVACQYHQVFPKFISKPKFSQATIGLLFLFGIQLLAWPKYHRSDLPVQLTFAATTIFVAVREELVYRYVIQNYLEGWLLPKDRLLGSILITSLAFTMSHLGAQYVSYFPWIFLASLLLGAIYVASGKSLTLVIFCHFVEDAFFELY